MDELHNQWRENSSPSIELSFPETIIHLREKHPRNTMKTLECLHPMNNETWKYHGTQMGWTLISWLAVQICDGAANYLGWVKFNLLFFQLFQSRRSCKIFPIHKEQDASFGLNFEASQHNTHLSMLTGDQPDQRPLLKGELLFTLGLVGVQSSGYSCGGISNISALSTHQQYSLHRHNRQGFKYHLRNNHTIMIIYIYINGSIKLCQQIPNWPLSFA